ncbi:hypothetical protein LCGC14_0618600 [marine sediment metagenome]|uniref:Uncharacterized protein n=1 Tax=marine sediment metagenome TaxID=412755 RepID=A0A0F9TRX0_9ZZZZ
MRYGILVEDNVLAYIRNLSEWIIRSFTLAIFW